MPYDMRLGGVTIGPEEGLTYAEMFGAPPRSNVPGAPPAPEMTQYGKGEYSTPTAAPMGGGRMVAPDGSTLIMTPGAAPAAPQAPAGQAATAPAPMPFARPTSAMSAPMAPPPGAMGTAPAPPPVPVRPVMMDPEAAFNRFKSGHLTRPGDKARITKAVEQENAWKREEYRQSMRHRREWEQQQWQAASALNIAKTQQAGGVAKAQVTSEGREKAAKTAAQARAETRMNELDARGMLPGTENRAKLLEEEYNAKDKEFQAKYRAARTEKEREELLGARVADYETQVAMRKMLVAAELKKDEPDMGLVAKISNNMPKHPLTSLAASGQPVAAPAPARQAAPYAAETVTVLGTVPAGQDTMQMPPVPAGVDPKVAAARWAAATAEERQAVWARERAKSNG